MQRGKEQMEKDINNCEEGDIGLSERQNAEQMSQWRCSTQPHNFTMIYLCASGQDQTDTEKSLLFYFSCSSYTYTPYTNINYI